MLEVLWSVGAFVVALGVLVAFHEFGHYWVARRCGVRVLRFSIGFGKPLWRRTARDGVEWVIAAIPLGGYVKMLDEREGEVPAAQLPQAFNRQNVWKRIAIVAAGPLFNFALAALFYWAVLVIGTEGLKTLIAEPPAGSAAATAQLHAGEQILSVDGTAVDTWQVLRTELIDAALGDAPIELRVQSAQGAERVVALPLASVRVDPEFLFDDLGLAPYQPPIAPVLAEIVSGSPAAEAGFQAGDRLLARDGVPIRDWQDWAGWLRAHPGMVTDVRLIRDGRELRLRLLVGTDPQAGEPTGFFGARVEVSPDLWQDLRAEYRLGPLAAAPAALAQTGQMSWLTLKMLFRMVIGDVSVKNVSGPIQIAQYAGYSAAIGLVSFLSFMAIVSVSLGVLNLLPVPLLDGGHLLFYVMEIIKGSPLSERVQMLGQQVGLTALVLLMGLAFYNDIMRLIG